MPARPSRAVAHSVDASETETIARQAKKPSGGHWNSGIEVLRNNGLIEVEAGSHARRYRVAALLRE